ncbi:hypothetical protein OWM54_34790 [Myxococcus sp. MISCRS1]|uniref:hypothetical protein n=1 Tax=Myxococcus sp. MISCRS1 TaxID=2996786 RepID=UPI002270C153|nr:hypothetical protein [Myxococcus sp. MISCRS1]MCY1002334.1 hypothetical protein [Myxococcus sp. MISCRS1]
MHSDFMSLMTRLLRKSTPWCLSLVLLTACASSPSRPGHGDLRFDTETAARLRHAAAVSRSATGAAATRDVASQLIKLAPATLILMKHDEAVNELEERLVDCAIQAERQINNRFFGGRPPTRNECLETVEVDACGKSVTRAMHLGQQKHVLALKCAREVLDSLWPAPFSIEQRYRYYPQAKILETIGRAEEARLLRQGCGQELWRTIKPDIVLHESHDLLKSALTLDFKFPCPNTNQAQWTRYGASSAYSGKRQDEIYTAALGGKTVIISPREGVVP